MTVSGQVDLRSATDDQLRTLVDTIRDALPNELTEPLKVLAEVSRRLTELQHRREAEAGTQCCMCGKTGLSTIEGDGGQECELDDGRWVCSGECWDRALAASPSSPASGVTEALKQARKFIADDFGDASDAHDILAVIDAALADEGIREGWQPIETLKDREGRYLFWLDWSDDCAPLNPPLPANDPGRWHAGRYGSWTSVYKATHWRSPLPPQPLPTLDYLAKDTTHAE